ncbi:hypothetical protein E2K80_10555 [Rhodophyticola sp. CCM32]|uniref:hypothetical protein n=1 Tax=Rhodophyticola sp. CCM32 TaxID=2916397 RepID=UPI00107F308E|nr:hypothetical protein [Rhodophyticola sp. CCM32]QBY01110.1 hypothetical protein E2K80_10555 [Rhodophyticola sp. CCM32]
MSRLPNTHALSPAPPSLTVDWELYAAMLEESDLPLDQQRELIEILWSIVVMFVDLGFDVDPVRQICGQEDEALSDDPPDLLSLMEQEWADQSASEEDSWTE